MSYAGKQDMIDRYGDQELIQLTDRATPPTGVIDDTVLNRALADADAEIGGYLQSRYTLPLSPVPAVIVKLACVIARYNLYEDAATEEVRRRYEDARRTLEAIAKGLVSLGVDAATGPNSSGGPITTSRTRVFDEGSLEDY